MKKIASLLLAIGVLFSIGGCSKNKVEDEAITAFIESFTKLSDVNSFELVADFKAEVENSSGSGTLHGEVIVDKENPQAAFSLDLESDGTPLNDFASVYIKDKTAYISFMGMKVKQTMDIENSITDEVIENANTDNDDLNIELIKPYFKSASKSGETIEMEFDIEKLKELSKENNENADVQDIESMKVKETVEDGTFKSIEIDVKVGGTTPGTVTFTISLNKLNSVESINFPNLDDYIENSNSLE